MNPLVIGFSFVCVIPMACIGFGWWLRGMRDGGRLPRLVWPSKVDPPSVVNDTEF